MKKSGLYVLLLMLVLSGCTNAEQFLVNIDGTYTGFIVMNSDSASTKTEVTFKNSLTDTLNVSETDSIGFSFNAVIDKADENQLRYHIVDREGLTGLAIDSCSDAELLYNRCCHSLMFRLVLGEDTLFFVNRDLIP